MMESWGRGIGLIMETCEKAGLPKPTIEVSVSFVNLTIYFAEAIGETNVPQDVPRETTDTIQVTTQDTIQVTIQVRNVLYAIRNAELSSSEIREKLGLINRSHFTKEYLSPALEQGLIEMTIPDKPNSRYQKYRLTEKGKFLFVSANVVES